uniref:Uncharacterized protein n=1 Tax=Anopheles quadriannulatus TaxID=34691 RepID=A0A182XQC5_ANOQN
MTPGRAVRLHRFRCRKMPTNGLQRKLKIKEKQVDYILISNAIHHRPSVAVAEFGVHTH